MAAGGQHGRADLEAAHQRGERLGLEPVHDHQRGAGPQPEQRVVEPGVERHRHRDEVGRRRFVGSRAAAAERAEHAVEQLDVRGVGVVDRLRAGRWCPTSTSRRPRRRRSARPPASGARRRPRSTSAAGRGRGQHVRRPRRSGRRGLTGTYTPPASHTPTIVETSSGPFGSWTATARPSSVDRSRSATARAAVRGLPRGHRAVDGVEQPLVVAEGMLEEQAGQGHVGGAQTGSRFSAKARGPSSWSG